MSKQLRLDVAQLTDVGRKRPHNEDNMAYVIPKDPQVMARKGALFIVADGMGGHAAGEVASEIAVYTVSNTYYQDDNDDISASLLHSIKRANTLIHQRAAENMLRSGMGTTCVAAVFRGNTAYIANVGDSRSYLVRHGTVRQISQDHSWVEEQVRAGLLTREQARSHAQRNVITRCLGTQPEVEVDVFMEQLEEGDVFILCSDGLSGLVSDEDLRVIVDQYIPQESVYHLVERANENGGPDNITAIVVRVQEVGWELPNARHPVSVGGREISEDMTMQVTPTAPISNPMRLDDARMPISPVHFASGPLGSPNSFTAIPSPITQVPHRTPNRLLYLTLAVFMLLAVMLVSGGTYYFLRGNNMSSVDGTLNQSQTLVTQAQGDLIGSTANPAAALQLLATAQKNLRIVQHSSLTPTQHQKLTSILDGEFTTTVKNAINVYNSQSSITALPCTSTKITPVSTGSTGTQASSIAMVQDSKGNTFSYALGEDHNLYQLSSQDSLVNKLTSFPPTAQIRAITSDGSRLLALTYQSSGNYALNLLVPGTAGALTVINTSTINSSAMQNGKVPLLITAWSQNVYVVLTSATAQNTATILDYTISATNKLTPDTTTRVISISPALESIAAFPNGQLFLLEGDGIVRGLSFSGNQPPASITKLKPIASPLSVSAQNFTANTPVPSIPVPSTSPFVTVSNAFLMAGEMHQEPHLYIVDNTYHRILDLASAKGALTTSLTPTPTTATSNVGGGVASTAASNQVTMQLNQQYISPPLLANIKSLVADPNPTSNRLALLAQNAQSAAALNLISVNVSQTGTCIA